MSDYRPSGRVVVTGLGAVTPLGIGVDVFWPRMLSGENGIAPITLFDASAYATRFAAEAREFVAEDFVDKKEARKLDRFLLFSVAAAQMAIDDSGITFDEDLKENTGVLIGSGIGGLETMSEQARKLFTQGPDRVSPFLVPYMIPDMASGYVSIFFGLRGPNICVVSACATGNNAIGEAFHMINRGEAKVMLAGGSEAGITPIGMAGFCAARAMSTRNDDPAHASRPFDKDRDGFVMGEGAGVLVLEDLNHALARGAKIYGEIGGYASTADAHHITAPDPEGRGARRAMRLAIERAGLETTDIDYVNAHGTSTPLNDVSETGSIKAVLGEHAYKIPVSSTKSSTGHLLGAAGAVEAVVCLLAMRDQIAPPTINFIEPGEGCDLDYVPNVARPAKIKAALSNAFGFGGHNATVVMKAYP